MQQRRFILLVSPKWRRPKVSVSISRGQSFRWVLSEESTDAMADIRKSCPALSGRWVILFLSRIDPKKNLEALIDAMKILDPFRSLDVLLIVAGNGNSEYVTV